MKNLLIIGVIISIYSGTSLIAQHENPVRWNYKGYSIANIDPMGVEIWTKNKKYCYLNYQIKVETDIGGE